MESSELPRHKPAKSLIARYPEADTGAAIDFWEQMAAEIVSIVGEGGFNSLYARSIFLTQSTFPWLAAASPSPQADERFAQLKLSLEGQAPAQAGAANNLLLTTFTDILASLIGEQLTSGILSSAWGNYAAKVAGKELGNE